MASSCTAVPITMPPPWIHSIAGDGAVDGDGDGRCSRTETAATGVTSTDFEADLDCNPVSNRIGFSVLAPIPPCGNQRAMLRRSGCTSSTAIVQALSSWR